MPAGVGRVSGNSRHSRHSGRRVDAVTFDFWETLCRRRPGALEARRAELISVVAAGVGVTVATEVLDGAMSAVWDVYVEEWRANRQFSGTDAARWVAALLAESHPALAAGAAQGGIIEAFHRAGDDADLILIDGVGEVLAALSASGVKLGIVCDVGFLASSELRRALDRHRVLEHFDHWSFSDDVGVFKPDRRIFEHALTGLGGVDPARSAHVGDIRRTDIAGARAMGMLAIRFRGVSDDRSDEHAEADIVIDDHRDLVDIVLGT